MPERNIVIGLGGTGGQVLSRVRERFIQSHGSADAWPALGYLYLDTEVEELQQRLQGEPGGLTDPDWLINLEEPDTGPFFNEYQAGNFANYHWLSYERLKDTGSITEGAKTIRQLGRLCFWRKAEIIAQALRREIEQLRHDEVRQQMAARHQVQIDYGLSIHIVAGLAGGTGSGIFLDMAFLARELAKQSQWPGALRVIGYLVLPQAYASISERCAANGYAALKELSFYQYRTSGGAAGLASLYGRPRWEAAYTDHLQVVSDGQLAFEECYLLGLTNMAGITLNSREQLYAMMARYLFDQCTADYAAHRQGMKSNVVGTVNSNDRLDCPAAFQSFGQAEVLLPRLAIRELLTYELALQAVQRLVDHQAELRDVVGDAISADPTMSAEDQAAKMAESLRNEAETEDLRKRARAYLVKEYQAKAQLRAQDLLASIVMDHNQRIPDLALKLKNEQRQNWSAQRWKKPEFRTKLSTAWDQHRKDFSDDGGPSAWGVYMKKMEANATGATKTVAQRIHDELQTLLRDPNEGPAFALAFLEQLELMLLNTKAELLHQANDPLYMVKQLGTLYFETASGTSGQSLSSILESQISERYQDLCEEIERGVFNIKAVQAQAYRYLEVCCDWCRARVEERARRLAANLLDALVEEISDYRREVTATVENLARLQLECAEMARRWHDRGLGTEHVGELLYTRDSAAAIVGLLRQKLADRPGGKMDPAKLAEQCLAELGKQIDALTPEDIILLRNRLLAAAREALGELTDDDLRSTHFAAYDLLVALHGGNRQKLRQVLTETMSKALPYIQFLPVPVGAGWDPTPGSFPDHPNHGRMAVIPGGRPDPDPDPEREMVVAELGQVTGWDAANHVRPTANTEHLVFATELAGFPLRALAGIEELRAAYQQFRQLPTEPPLHLERDDLAVRFPELVPPRPADWDEARTLRAVALALEVLAPQSFPQPEDPTRLRTAYALTVVNPLTGTRRFVEVAVDREAIAAALLQKPKLLDQVRAGTEAALQAHPAELVVARLRDYLLRRAEEAPADYPGQPDNEKAAYLADEQLLTEFIKERGLPLPQVVVA